MPEARIIPMDGRGEAATPSRRSRRPERCTVVGADGKRCSGAVIADGLCEEHFAAAQEEQAAGAAPDWERKLAAGQPATDFVSGRTAGVYRHNFTKAAFAQQSIEVLPNLKEGDDYRINSETSVVAPISRHIALKSAFVIHFVNLPELG